MKDNCTSATPIRTGIHTPPPYHTFPLYRFYPTYSYNYSYHGSIYTAIQPLYEKTKTNHPICRVPTGESPVAQSHPRRLLGV